MIKKLVYYRCPKCGWNSPNVEVNGLTFCPQCRSRKTKRFIICDKISMMKEVNPNPPKKG